MLKTEHFINKLDGRTLTRIFSSTGYKIIAKGSDFLYDEVITASKTIDDFEESDEKIDD